MNEKNNHTLNLSIGDVNLLIYSDSEEFMDQTEKKYSNFICEDLDPDIRIEGKLLPYEDGEEGFGINTEVPEVTVDRSNGIYTINWMGIYGEFNMKSMEGWAKCRHFIRFDSFLRFIYVITLLKESGFLVHASSVIQNDKGYLFPGKSGAGKTTITQLSPDATLLTDEISLVKKVNGNFHLFGTPFWGDLQISGVNTHTPVKSVYFPKKDDKTFKKSVGVLKTFEMLLPNVISFGDDKEITKQLFEICFDFANSVPGHELHFLPDPSFWRVIDDE
jgi:hypothetical protein